MTKFFIPVCIEPPQGLYTDLETEILKQLNNRLQTTNQTIKYTVQEAMQIAYNEKTFGKAIYVLQTDIPNHKLEKTLEDESNSEIQEILETSFYIKKGEKIENNEVFKIINGYDPKLDSLLPSQNNKINEEPSDTLFKFMCQNSYFWHALFNNQYIDKYVFAIINKLKSHVGFTARPTANLLTTLKESLNNELLKKRTVFFVEKPLTMIPFVSEFFKAIQEATALIDIQQWIIDNQDFINYVVDKNSPNLINEKIKGLIKNSGIFSKYPNIMDIMTLFENMGSYKVYANALEVGTVSHDLKIICKECHYLSFKKQIDAFTVFFALHYMLIYKTRDEYHKAVYEAFVKLLQAFINKPANKEFKNIYDEIKSDFGQRAEWLICGIKYEEHHRLWIRFDKLKNVTPTHYEIIAPQYLKYIQNIEKWMGDGLSRKELHFIQELNARINSQNTNSVTATSTHQENGTL